MIFTPCWELAEPVAVRSTRSGGDWRLCRADNGGNTWYALDLPAIRSELRPLDFKILLNEIKVKMQRAEKGQLRLETLQNPGGEVEQTRAQPLVLKMGFSAKMTPNLTRRHVRIYFTEPRHRARELLLLYIVSKADGRVGIKEQTQHIHLACLRGHVDLSRS